MKSILLQEDVAHVEARLKVFEARTGCELLLVVADSSDPYPGASWRFGVVGGFLLLLIFSYYLDFHHTFLWPVSMLIATVFMTWVGHFSWAKRLALTPLETGRECAEKAIELFHTLGTSKVSHKVTAMIMISVLERNIQVLVDEKLKTELTATELGELIELMKGHFRDGNMGLGLTKSIEKLEEKILLDFGGKVSQTPPSELSDTIHFIRSAP